MKFKIRSIDNGEFLNTDYDIFTENVKAIENNNGLLIGYVEFYYYKEENKISIEMIEMIEKGKGYGKAVIEWFFESYNIESMCGYVLIDWDLVAYKFWRGLGSDINFSEEEAIDEVDGTYFTLNKENLLEGMKMDV